MMSNLVIARAFSTSVLRSSRIESVTVIGAGIMGSGIAQVAAQSGHKVTLVDQNEDLLKKANQVMSESMRKITKKKGASEDEAAIKVTEIMKNVSSVTDHLDACRTSDLIVEAIVEDLDIKKKLFKQIDKVAPESCIFASNTSGLLISSIAEVTERKDKFAGLHFFNPVVMMKLCEIVSTPEVSRETIESLNEFGKKIGKVCVHCKDTPGFIVNRLLIPYVMEALRMAERGVASTEDIDTAMRLGCGYPMGPFQLLDFSGMDTYHRVISDWHKEFPDESLFLPSKLLSKKVDEGKLGVKTGEGFYKYSKK